MSVWGHSTVNVYEGAGDNNLTLHSCPAILDLRLNNEAMAALEESLNQQIMAVAQGMKNRDESFARVEEEIDHHQGKIDKEMDLFDVKDQSWNMRLLDGIAQRDTAMMDLRNVEQSFSDVHRKYERSKQIIENLKANEETLKARDMDIQNQIYTRDEKFELFKQEANDMLEKLYIDFTEKTSELESENTRLAANLRRCQMRSETLEAELEQKLKENVELNALVDEIIGKTASKSLIGKGRMPKQS